MKKTLFLIPFLAILLFPITSHASTFPDGCSAHTKYSSTTGHLCQTPPCSPGDLFNFNTGQKCVDTNTTTSLPEGCLTTDGFSPLTGVKCDGSTVVTPAVISTPVVNQQNTIQDAIPVITPTTVYKILYPDTPISLNKQSSFHVGMEIGGGTNPNEIVYITTPDGVRHIGNRGAGEWQKYEFATDFELTQPGSYPVRFEAPVYGIDQTVSITVVS